MASLWYALRIKPHKERFVYDQLQEREVEVFYPSIHVKPKNPRSRKERPYFPGYMFIKADLEQEGYNAYSWLPGVHGLVSFGGTPAVVPETLLKELKTKLADIHSEEALMLNRLKKGDRIRIVSGPMAGYEAIFDMRLPGKERVQILLTFLSQHPQPAQLDADDIVRLKQNE